MRILHILDHSIPLHSGYTFRTAAILREQRALGWQTFHLTSPKQGSAEAEFEDVEGLRFHRCPIPPAAPAGINELRLMRSLEDRLEQLVADLRPNILHAHSPVLNALPAIRVGRRHSIPVVYEIRAFWEDAAVDHGTTREGSLRYRLTRALETWTLRRVDHVFTICQGLRRDILGRGIPEDRVTVVPNAVDIEGFQLSGPADRELKSSFGLDRATVLGFVGSFYAYEGLDLLLAALPALLARRPELRVLLVGGGPQENNLKLKARQLGVAEKVVFAGRVPHGDVHRYYQLIDLLVYPRHSMRLTELVTPLKPLEAMAQGGLFIASDVGGHRELIRDGENGRLFAAGSPSALAETVSDMLTRRDQWPAYRLAGRRFVETERNWRNSVAQYRDAYARLVGAPAV